MSYNYSYNVDQSQYGTAATTPTTPSTYPSPWDSNSPQETNPQPTPAYPQIVQLPEAPVVQSQHRYSYNAESASSRNQSTYATGSGADARPEGSAAAVARTRLGVDTTRPRTTLPVRTQPIRPHHVQTPYRRPADTEGGSSASASGSRARQGRLSEDLRNLAVGLTPGPPTIVSCPAQGRRSSTAPTRLSMTRGSASSPVATGLTPASATQNVQQQSDASVSLPVHRYNIRSDVHFNAQSNVMTAVFELPGVKKTDVSITLAICPFSRVKQVSIIGKLKSVLPEDSEAEGHFTVRERKYGDFARTLIVPHDARADTIKAEMQDGVLILKVPGGARLESSSRETVAVI